MLSKGKNIIIDADNYKNQLNFNKCTQVDNYFKVYEPKTAK